MAASLGTWGRWNPSTRGSLSPAAREDGGRGIWAGTGLPGWAGVAPWSSRTLGAPEGTLHSPVDTRAPLRAAPARTQQLALGAPALLGPASPFLRLGGGWRLRFEELAPVPRGESDFLSPERRVRGSPSPATPTIAGRRGPQVALWLPLLGGLCLGSNPSRGRVSTGAKSWRARWAWRPLPPPLSPGHPAAPAHRRTPSRSHPTPESGSIHRAGGGLGGWGLSNWSNWGGGGGRSRTLLHLHLHLHAGVGGSAGQVSVASDPAGPVLGASHERKLRG